MTAILAVLSRGRHDGESLYHEVTLTSGSPPSLVVWRNLLIELTQKRVITRDEIRDDNNKLVEVSYSLPNITKIETGESNGTASTTV